MGLISGVRTKHSRVSNPSLFLSFSELRVRAFLSGGFFGFWCFTTKF